MTDDEVNKLNQERVNQLAAAIATKIQPFTPLPTTPEDAERQQTEQVNKVGDRLSQRIQPILAQMAADQNLTRDSINDHSTHALHVNLRMSFRICWLHTHQALNRVRAFKLCKFVLHLNA